MGNIQKRSDGKYRARYRDPAGRERARHFRRKIDAERWLSSVEVAKARGEWVDPGLGKVTVGEWGRQWLAGQVHLKPSTRERYGVALRNQILPTWERVRISAVTHAGVATWVQELAGSGLAPATIRYAHRVLALLLEHAVRDGRLSRNPAKGVRMARSTESDKIFLSHAQVSELAVASEPHGLLVRVLAYTGLRWGELAALRVRRVDLLRRRLIVAEATSEVAGKVVFGTPKSHQRRSVPLPRFLVEPLSQQLEGKGPDDLVFTSPSGGVLRNTNFRHRVFNRAAACIGIPGLTPHDLRHTAASLAVQVGANVKVVQQMLGHASAAMTLDVYTGLFGDDLDAVADRLHEAVTRETADPVRTLISPEPSKAQDRKQRDAR